MRPAGRRIACDRSEAEDRVGLETGLQEAERTKIGGSGTGPVAPDRQPEGRGRNPIAEDNGRDAVRREACVRLIGVTTPEKAAAVQQRSGSRCTMLRSGALSALKGSLIARISARPEFGAGWREVVSRPIG